MVANVLCWRTGNLASTPSVCEKISGSGGGWGGGAIQEDFARKFLEHDGNSPRRLATFLTEEEWLYEMDWGGSLVNDGTLEQKQADPMRGISMQSGLYSHGPYFEWKLMVYHNPPKILTQGKEYPADNLEGQGGNSNQTNFNLARYAEALLLYAEACLGSPDEKKGLKALQDVQRRSGSGKISKELTLNDIQEEKQYELWFEGCRFHDLVRWSLRGFADLNKIYNSSGIHERIPTLNDAYFLLDDNAPAYPQYYGKEHHLVESYSQAKFNAFTIGRHEYLPFPRDVKIANPNLTDVRGWEDYK
jgi:SusD family.